MGSEPPIPPPQTAAGIALRDSVGKALFLHQVKLAREEVDARTDGIRGADDFFLKLKAESDTVFSIVSFSFIDSRLTDIIIGNLPNMNTAAAKGLFSPNGPLSTSAAKLNLVFALGWLSETTSHDLNILRKIRNAFAHDPYARTIEEEPFRSWVTALSNRESGPITAILAQHHLPALQLRQAFQLRTVTTCLAAASELISHPAAFKHGVPPGALMASAEGSSIVREHVYQQVDFILRYFNLTNLPNPA